MDDEPLVIHRRARNPKQVVEKPVKIRRRKQVEHKCKACEDRAEKEALYWKQVAEASKAMQPIATTAVYTGPWSTTPNYPTYGSPATWTTGTTYNIPDSYTVQFNAASGAYDVSINGG